MTAPKLLCAFILAATLPAAAEAATGSYGVPPSPYGQVGNPFLAPMPTSTPTSTPTAVPYTVLHTAAPVPVKPAPVAVAQPVQPTSKPLPAPAPQTVASAPTAPRPVTDDGYQVPATSKYAARINAARIAAGAAGAAASTAAHTVASNAPSVAVEPAQAATTPAPATDHVFVPGEHYTDASEAPRQYSLHRQWGLTPDKISTDHVATGALLTLTDVPGSDSTGSGTATPTDKDNSPTEDDGAEAPSTAKTATP